MGITDGMYQLGTAARRLNTGSDQLNDLLGAIDDTLAKLMIGMEYVHPRPLLEETSFDADGKRIIEMWYLAYLKVNGRFRMSVKDVKIMESRKQGAFQAPGRVIALLEAPRKVRHRAVDFLPDLVGGLAEQVDDVLDQMERRCEVATNVLAHLEDMLLTESGSYQREFDVPPELQTGSGPAVTPEQLTHAREAAADPAQRPKRKTAAGFQTHRSESGRRRKK